MKRFVLWSAVIVALALSLALCVAAPAFSQATPSQVPSRDGITLREYVDVRFAAQQSAVEAALASADRAVAKAEAASDKRFEGVNEFRAALNDNTRTLMPRAEAEQAFKAMDEKLATLTARVNARDERSVGAGGVAAWIIAGISAAAAVFAMLSKRGASR